MTAASTQQLPFVAFNALGAALWVATWTTAGYFAGGDITGIYDTVSRYSVYLAVAIACVIVSLVIRHIRRHRTTSEKGAH